jgi:hypothetical protein
LKRDGKADWSELAHPARIKVNYTGVISWLEVYNYGNSVLDVGVSY